MAHRKPVYRSSVLLLLLSMATGLPVFAQTLLEEIVVTATRTEKLVKNSPYSISVITDEELKRFNQDQLADLVAQLPGIQVSDSGQAGQKRIRIRGEEARRMALLINGQEFIDHREVGVPMLIDSTRIQRVELVRGPASVLYGPKAMGGVINVITDRNISEPFTADVSASYNSATSGRLLSLQLNGLAGDQFLWNLGGFTNDQDDRESPEGTIENTDYESDGFNAGVRFQGNTHSAGLAYEQYRSASSVYVEPEIRFTPPFLDFSIDAPRRDRNKIRADYSYTPLGKYLQSIKADAYHQVSDREFNTFPSLSLAPGLVTDTSIFTTSDLISDGVNIQADFQFGDNFSAIAGIQWVQDEIDQDRVRSVAINGFPASNEMTNDKGELSTAALYLQGDVDLTDKLSLIAGIRTYDVDGELTGSTHLTSEPDFDDQHTIVSTALVFEVSEQSTVRMSYAEGYIFPSLLNLVVGAYAGSSFIHPVATLKPETSETIELGYRFGNGSLSVDSVIFYTQADNYIDHEPCAPMDNCPGRRDRIYRNVGESNSHGIELGLGYDWNAWRLQGAVTWMQREKIYENVDTYDSGIPNVTGNLRVQYTGKLWQQPAVYALTTRFESDSEELIATRRGFRLDSNAGYGVTDLEVMLHPIKDTSLAMTLGNLTDKAYHSATENLLAPGRHLRLKLAVTL